MFKEAQQAVTDFHKQFGHPVSFSPAELARERLEKRITWMMEELGELVSARNFADQLDAMADLLYFVLGTFVEMGVDGSEVFKIVHNANMRKTQGKFRYGKTQKPVNWLPPESEIALYITEMEVKE